MNIVVIGLGQVGRYIADFLFREKHNLTLIDKDPEVLEKVGEGIDALTIAGHGASAQVLATADVPNADLVIAVSSSDEVNLLAAATSKQFGAKRTIARVSEFDLWKSSQPVSRGLLDIDLIINIKMIAALEIIRLIRSMEAVLIEDFADSKIEVEQLPVSDSCRILHTPLKDINFPGKSIIASIIRNGELIVPGGDDMIEENDEIIVIGDVNAIPEMEKLIEGTSLVRMANKVALLGGGEIAFWVAKFLMQKKLEVMIIDSDRERCVELSEQLDGVTVINGDATSTALLKEEGVDAYDVCITLTNDDELNLMTALLAKGIGVERTIALVHKPDYMDVYREIGISVTVSPRLVAAKQILKYTREKQVRSVTPLLDGAGEILEITASPESKITTRPLEKVGFPRGAVIGAVTKSDGSVFIPRGPDTIEAGETAVIFMLPRVRKKVIKLFN